MPKPVRNAPTGTMNLDLDPRYLNEGKYRFAKNVRPITDEGGTTLDIEPVKGTRQEISFGAVNKQNKQYKVIGSGSGESGEAVVKVFDENGNLKFIESGGSISDMAQFLFNKLNNKPNITVTSPSTDVALITFDNGVDWTLVLEEPSGNAYKNYYIFQEELSGPDNTGPLHMIGKVEYHDKLYVFLTTCQTVNGGLGEIGVIQQNTDDTLTYTRAIRSKEFKFSTLWQIDADAEENDFRSSLYWTDNVNNLRKFIHEGIGNNDFGLSFNGGRYDLGSIADQTKLIPAPTLATISPKGGRNSPLLGDAGQRQVGGSINSGTWRYTVRFLTQELAESAWITLTNQIPVFKASTNGPPSELLGSAPDTETGKVNVLEVRNIDTTRFSFIELAGVHYIGESPSGYIIKRERITGSTMELLHTGNESNSRNIGNLASLINLQTGINTAKNLRILDNRLFISNVKFKVNVLSNELQNIADNIQVQWNKHSLPGLGNELNKYGEFMLPWFCHDYMGYCSGETYRFGIRFVLADGSFTDVYHVADTGPPISGDITTGGVPRDVLINYPVFTNIDLSSVSNEVIGIQPMRVEMTEDFREVLTTGLLSPYVYNNASKLYGPNQFETQSLGFSNPATGSLSYEVFSLVSPDQIFGDFVFEFRFGDDLYLKEVGNYNQKYFQNKGGSSQLAFLEYDGKSTSSQTASVNDFLTLEADSRESDNPKINTVSQNDSDITNKNWIDTNVVSFSSSITYNVKIKNYVFYYRRSKTNKFGDLKNSRYIPCSQIYSVNDLNVNNANIGFFGGDTFIQKTIMQTAKADDIAIGGIVTFYSENRVNSQLFYNEEGDGKGVWPQNDPDLEPFLNDKSYQATEYDTANSFHNKVQVYAARNPDRSKVTRSENRIYFSELNPTNSFSEKYGQFLPLNYKDVDPKYGPINHMEDLNGELHHWQPRAFTREYVNSRGLIKPEDSTRVLIGSNEVLPKESKILSSYGTNHKWSVVKARSQGGNDVAYWYSSEFEKMLRFGYDGTVPISDIKGLQSWFPNNVSGMEDFDNPTALGGIHGVWDERFNEVLMTFVQSKLDNVLEYTESNLDSEGYIITASAGGITVYIIKISKGTVFKYDDGNGYRLYAASQDISKSGSNKSQLVSNTAPDTTTNIWEYAPITNTDAYKVDTVVLNEMKNGFTGFYDYNSTIYAPINNSIISQNPSDQTIHLHNVGDELVFYGAEYEGNIKMPINIDLNLVKTYQAIDIQCEKLPFRVEFETQEHESYLTFFDFEERESRYVSEILLDSKLDGINDRASEILRGSYLFVDFYFEPRKYNKLFNFVVKVAESPRTYKA